MKRNSNQYKFTRSKNVPDNLNVTAVIGLAFLGDEIIMIQHNDSVWDLPGGHIEIGEGASAALERELKEEAGVTVVGQEIVGYINGPGNERYKSTDVIAVFSCLVVQIDEEWKPSDEIIGREKFRKKHLTNLLSNREDVQLILDITKYGYDDLQKKFLNIDFKYIPNGSAADVPVTQVFSFIEYKGLYCVVRDGDENHWSLPGGAADIGESPQMAAARELREEAQITIKPEDFILIGTILVTIVYKTGHIIMMQHQRFIAKTTVTKKFNPNHKYETAERKFVPLAEIAKLDMMSNPAGQQIISYIEP